MPPDPPDCFKVDLIYIMNPHVMWIQTSDGADYNEFIFEQIGLYGILPQEITLDIDEAIKIQNCDSWTEGATTFINNSLCKCTEVWFSPIYIHKRSSIFDKNIHRYGDIILKLKNGTYKNLSKLMTKANLARIDICEFHKLLVEGKIKTKLNSIETQEVLKKIDKYCVDKNISKTKWNKCLKNQTSVFQLTQQLDEYLSSLTTSNLEKHNNKYFNTVLENKIKDFELCKDIDEKSFGRGYKKSNDTNKESNIDPKQADVGNEKINDKQNQCTTKTESSSETKRTQQIVKEKKILESRKSDVSIAERNGHKETISNDQNEIDCHHRETPQILNINYKRMNVEKDNTKEMACCPPGYRHLDEITRTRVKEDLQDKGIERGKNYRSGELDSDLNIEINEGNLYDILHDDDSINITAKTKEVCHIIQNNDFSEKSIAKEKSTGARKKIMTKKIRSKPNNSSSSSSVSTYNNNIYKDFDDNIDEVCNKINEEYKNVLKDTNQPIKDYNVVEKVNKNNVNPFRNIDQKISVFVDKLVAPILLVHTKNNIRVQPVCQMRDINFNSHIRLVLRNMPIVKPMILQCVSWQTILRGYSIFIISPPSSGKTLGYLPAVCRLISDQVSDRGNGIGPVCIIVCATAKSIAHVESMAKMFLGLEDRVLACYAGVDESHIKSSLLNGVDLLICTPSALIRLMQLKDSGVDLRRLSTFVIDDCERIATTYIYEVKFFLIKIGEMLKQKVNNESKVQYIIASRVWCDFMTPLAIKAPDTVISIGAFQECVLYSKANTSVSFVKIENKINSVIEFLKEIDASKKTVIVCKSDEDVELLERALKRSKHIVFASNNNMTVHDLFNLSLSWADYKEPVVGPILICCDGNLTHMNITDAHNLIHYTLPHLFSMFCKRFSVLNDNYPSIFKAENENVKIKILLDETNVEQLPKILNFIKRCSSTVPSSLDDICEKITTEKELVKASRLVPICDIFLMLGECPNVNNCIERHSMFAEYDKPQDWMPKQGIITFKILHYHTAASYSALLLTNVVNGVTTTYPETFSSLSLKLGLYYGNESNQRLHGIPKIGDICAVSMKMSFFARCKVVKILSFYHNGNPDTVLVNLIDKEKYEVTKDIYLYYLPEELKEIQTSVVVVILGNIQPKDKDTTFSELACNQIKKLTANEDLYMKGHVALTLGNCIFVDTLEACQELTSLNKTVVKYDLKKELLDNHALANPDHINKLEKLCNEIGMFMEKEMEVPEIQNSCSNIAKGTWAHLESDTLSTVFLSSTISPDKFFVRLVNFESCIASLLQDIKKYTETYTFTDEFNAKEGDMVLAEFPEDSTYERAKIYNINGDKVKCFFVDQGDLLEISLNKIIPITDKLINQLPFQAIECRLIGIKPPGYDWPDFSLNWFSDNHYQNNNGALKHLFVKYFTKEKAELTDGFKYGVALIDTNADTDVVINQLMVDLYLAEENFEEREYLKTTFSNEKDEEPIKSTKEGDEENLINIASNYQDNPSTSAEDSIIQLTTQTLSSNIIRSVPLVTSDSDDFKNWDVNIGNLDTLVSGVKNDILVDTKSEIIKNDSSKNDNQIVPCSSGSHKVLQELDSDDLTTSETSQPCSNEPKKADLISVVTQKSRPKLTWKQDKDIITVKIQLIGVESYNIEIDYCNLKFSAKVNDTEYELDLNLDGVVKKDACTHFKTGLYVVVKLVKIHRIKWPALSQNLRDKNFIAHDLDNIDISSDEDEVDKESIKKIVDSIQNEISESEDEEFLDDVKLTYRNH